MSRFFDITFQNGNGFPFSLSNLFDDRIFSVGRHFDVDESESAYVLTLELPGFKQADLDVSVENETLAISAKRGEHAFNQSVTLPRGIDALKIEGKLEDGILTLTLPKAESAKSRKVSVK